MTQSALDRLNLKVEILYRVMHLGETISGVARAVGKSRKQVYRILNAGAQDQRVMKSVEQKVSREMREEDKQYVAD